MTRLAGLLVPRDISRDVFSLCLMVFLADFMFGILAPTFSLFVVSLGGALAMVGALSSIVNLTRLVSTIPAGIASDLWGRKATLILGLALLTACVEAYGLTGDPQLLFIFRVVEGLGTSAVLTVGVAALSDAVPASDRGGTIGIYMTAMGFGYSIGGAVGGSLAQVLSFAHAYQVVAFVPFAALVFLWVMYQPARVMRAISVPSRLDPAAILRLGFDRYLLPANLGNFLISLSFSATVVAFFPLYAASVGVSAAVFGYFFGLRSLLSTLVRLPVGVASAGRTLPLMIGSLALVMIAMWMVPAASDALPLLGLLCVEGVAYGSFITVGQTYVSEYEGSKRGAIMGVYSTFGSLGSTLGSLFLGLLAQSVSLSSVFYATSLAIAFGIVLMGWMGRGMSRILDK